MPASWGFKVTIEYSFSPLVAPIRPIQHSIKDYACCASVFRPYYKGETQSKAHVVTITLATQVTRKAKKVASKG